MSYYKLTTPRLIMFFIFIITGAFYFLRTDIRALGLYELIISIIIFGVLTFLILSKLLSLKKQKNK